ncbi:MAG: hypothetical protein AB3X46_11875 [Leptothrix ochracea]|uniref:hypothetical protein n=1 Tax=Leptothrix ochracea TaxID=735331 RepID=UPI0034E2E772
MCRWLVQGAGLWRVWALLPLLSLLLVSSAHADEPGTLLTLIRQPIQLQSRFDLVALPQHESLGLLGGALLFDIDAQWAAGPALIGAASGRRGGFFALGAQVEHRWQLDPDWRFNAGLYVGGGGGGAAPVGSGLLVQPSLQLWRRWGAWQTGVSRSQLWFPDGAIRSQPWGLMLSWDGEFKHVATEAVGRVLSIEAPASEFGFGFDQTQLILSQYTTRVRPLIPSTHIQLVGMRFERPIDAGYPDMSLGLEAAAATHGGADGYMELLAALSVHPSASAWGLPPLHGGLRGALGLGGGGGLATGGGILAKAALQVSWDLAPNAQVGLETGVVQAPGFAAQTFQARTTQLYVGWRFDDLGGRSAALVRGIEWEPSWQHTVRALRRQGPVLPLDTVGLKIHRWLDEHLYLTGQWHSAFAGQAGAYGLGLLGLGWAERWLTPQLSGSMALLAGAAGGGGVLTEGGAVSQLMTQLGWRMGVDDRLQLGAGYLRGRSAQFASPVFELSWSHSFGVGERQP